MIFISHATKDDDFADDIRHWLLRTGFAVWVDHHDIPLGKHWDEVVEQVLHRSRVLILILSPESVASDNVRVEWKVFREQKKPIFPIMLQDCVPPMLIRHLHRLDFRDFNDHEKNFRRLINQLKRIVNPNLQGTTEIQLNSTDSELLRIRRDVRNNSLATDDLIGQHQFLLAVPSVQKSMLLDIDKEKMFIGWRKEEIDIKPDIDLTHYGAFAMGVSRQHALLEYYQGSLWLRDLDSKNGTYINKRRLPIDTRVRLYNGLILHLGKLALQIFYRTTR
jgi:hypothetical protein